MNNATVTFTYNGKTIQGQLSQVMGAGSTSHYHLMVNHFYWGQLFYSHHSQAWVFYGSDPGLSTLANHFSAAVADSTVQ